MTYSALAGMPAKRKQSADEYLQTAVFSASPSRLLIMLLDRLYLDMQRAEHAISAGTPQSAGPHLLHAQDIVTELTATLKVDAWEGAKNVQALYLFLYSSLVSANVTKDLDQVLECQELVGELRDTWTQAANLADPELGTEAQPKQAAVTAGTGAFTPGRATGPGELGVG